MKNIIDEAWNAYIYGSGLTAEQAADIHKMAYEYSRGDERLGRVITLVQTLAKEYARGERCSVCSEVDDPRCSEGC